jgi:hypothetical protein
MIPQIIGLGANILGGLISRSDANKSAAAQAEARNSVLREYLAKQLALEEESRGHLNKTVDTYGKGNTQLKDAQTARTGAVTETLGAASDPGDIPTSRSAPKNVRSEIAKRMLTAYQDATTRAKAMGAVGGYGDQWTNNNFNIGDTSRQMNTISNFARGNQNILSSQQDLAQIGATKQPSIWGPVLSAGGSLLMGMGGGAKAPVTPMASGPNLGGGIWAGL